MKFEAKSFRRSIEVFAKVVLITGILGAIALFANDQYVNEIMAVENVMTENCWAEDGKQVDSNEIVEPVLPEFMKHHEDEQTTKREQVITSEEQKQKLDNSSEFVDKNYDQAVVYLTASTNETVDKKYQEEYIWQMTGLVVGGEMIDGTPNWVILTANHGFTGYPVDLSSYFKDGKTVNISMFKIDRSTPTGLSWTGSYGEIVVCQKIMVDGQYSATLFKFRGASGHNPFEHPDSPKPLPLRYFRNMCDRGRTFQSIGFPVDGNDNTVNGPVRTTWSGPAIGINGDWVFGPEWWGLEEDVKVVSMLTTGTNYGGSGEVPVNGGIVCGISNYTFSISAKDGTVITFSTIEPLPGEEQMQLLLDNILNQE